MLIVALLALGVGGALAGAKKHKKRKKAPRTCRAAESPVFGL